MDRAGIPGNFVVKGFVRDMSPPNGGQVLDGDWDFEVNTIFYFVIIYRY